MIPADPLVVAFGISMLYLGGLYIGVPPIMKLFNKYHPHPNRILATIVLVVTVLVIGMAVIFPLFYFKVVT